MSAAVENSSGPGHPNIITIARLILVPVILLMILQERWEAAFGLFVVAGVSDAVDGTIARRFDMQSRFAPVLLQRREEPAFALGDLEPEPVLPAVVVQVDVAS